MRSPSPTFRADLSLYRGNLVYLQPQAPDAKHAAHASLAIAIIDRWLQHEDADRIWIELAAKLPPGYPARMIAGRLFQYRLQADLLSRGLARAPTIKSKFRTRVTRYRDQDTPEALAALIYESSVRLQTKELLERCNLPRGKNSPRTWFMAEWSECFRELCGKPLDNVACFLTKIAFDDDNVTPDMVRSARREMDKWRTRPPK